MYNVAGLQWNFHRPRPQSSGSDDDARGNAQVRQRMGEIKSKLNPEDAQRPDEVFFRVDNIREVILFMQALHQRNLQMHPVRSPQHVNICLLATLVEVQAMRKQGQTSRGSPVHAEDYILNSQTRLIGRTTWRNVGYNDSKIFHQVHTVRHIWGDRLNKSSYRGLMDVTILQ